ncbi:MAG: hypothetical protein KatS3mg059_0156 [Thermomicrobiales bacterium]|nr:MAG: hypothetical protein KatS3mg059_0156 [Thermomicrobiales bacterium]
MTSQQPSDQPAGMSGANGKQSDRQAELSITTDVLNYTGCDLSELETELPALAQFILQQEGQRGEWTITIVLTTDEHLRELHRQFMGIDEETDVMTFPLGDDGEHGGDIVISVDRADEQAAEAGHGLSDEIRFLAAHGLLHLCGWDDRDDPSRAAMLSRQSALLDALRARRRDTGRADDLGSSINS